jgi:hypothetical protein
MNGVLIAVDYCLQMKEITGWFDDEDVASAKSKLALFKDEMPADEYEYAIGIIDRLARSWK